MFKVILSVVPQGSILGPILFNVFLNALFLWLTKSDIHNFADENRIIVTSNCLEEAPRILKEESESAINWLRHNSMIVNPDKFQAINLDKKVRGKSYTLDIGNNEV